MSVPSDHKRPSRALPIVGIVLIVGGVIVGATRALGFLSFGPDRFELVPIPTDAFPSWDAPYILNYSIMAGIVLGFAGAIMIAAWTGYARGIRRAR